MATNDKQASEQGRQQSADMGPAGAVRSQQGYEPGQRGTERDLGAQRAGSQYGGSLQARGGTQTTPWSTYGAYGGGPLSVMRRISDEMDRLFEGFGFGRGAFGGDPGWQGAPTSGAEQGAALWSPHLEMFEREGKLVVTADLPGVKKEDVKVEVDQDAITIQGQRRNEQTSRQQGYYRSERSYGSFYRTIPLPEGADASTASATFRDGVLEISLQAPQKRAASRSLEIKDEQDAGASRSSGGESPQKSGGQQQR
ncbi:MAG TPA: Hsp20/alpha crystallin family protein [Casimicrobiaceae bacterium]|jgi:HSP20 family protein|nr:Hsp20/alpha crystallin family protein [Casimicrobiaceae bacterium]